MASKEMEEEYLNYKQLCEFLGIKYSTARIWKCQGKLTYTKFHGKIFFPKSAIIKELKKNIIKSVSSVVEDISSV